MITHKGVMHLHEYQAKELFQRYGIPFPPFEVVRTMDEAEAVLERTGWDDVILKIQVHAGGRGKAGGVRRCKGKQEILEGVKALLGFKLVNNQTGPLGVISSCLIIAPAITYVKEFYLAGLIDRKEGAPYLILSSEGGMEIEEVAAKSPEKILRLRIYPGSPLKGYQKQIIKKELGWGEEEFSLLENVAKVLLEEDATLVEINPLVSTSKGLLALDAKVSIDENALFRHKGLADEEDKTQLPLQEVEAKERGLAFVALEGSIGCVVNGAGLAMATMDLLHLLGGKPANFLDVGGSGTAEAISAGFAILLDDPKVKGIFVNIFGGIMSCETIAEGVIQALQGRQKLPPIVIRLEGTHVDQGMQKLKNCGLPLKLSRDLEEAASLIVQLVGK